MLEWIQEEVERNRMVWKGRRGTGGLSSQTTWVIVGMVCTEQVSPRERLCRSQKLRECSMWWLQDGSVLSLQ